MTISIVVATSRNGCIGRDGQLPWHLPADLQRFREITSGATVVMGRLTYESLPARFRPLPNRRNIVVSRGDTCGLGGAEVYSDLESALAAGGEDCFVIGGGSLYQQTMPVANRIYLTVIDSDIDGDTYFPSIAPEEWECISQSEPLSEDGRTFTFRVLERRRSLYDFESARTPDQLERMRRLDVAGVCVWCPEHVEQHHPEPIEYRGTYWYVTKNHYPYPGTVSHYLIVSTRHVTAFDELPDEAGRELWAIRRQLKAKLAPPATATVERSGDMKLNGASVAHLHTHFVTLDQGPAATVHFRVSARSSTGDSR